MNPRQRFLQLSDYLIIALIAFLVLGSVLCFGGEVWWFRPALSLGAFSLVFLKLLQYLAAGRVWVLKSPLTLLGLMVLGLGVIQLAPLPAALASRLSPAAHEAYMRGQWAERVHSDDVAASLPEAPKLRSPASLDRSATLRWVMGAAACLGIFWTVSHFTDRLRRLYLVWGLLIAGFLINTTFAVVQVVNGSAGLYGAIVPGRGPVWAPLHNDLLETPGTAWLRNLPTPKTVDRGGAHAVLVPERPFLFGTLMGGRGAFLALGMMAIPLATAIVLHLMAPRGSRESLSYRLGRSGQGSLVLLLLLLLLLSTIVTGLIAASWQCLPLAAGLVAVALPAVIRPGARWPAFGLAVLLFVGLGLGISVREFWPEALTGRASVQPPDFEATRSTWYETLDVIREFPLIGAGLGAFGTIHPYFKDADSSSNTAISSLLQWTAESGAIGLGLVAMGCIWCLVRLPGSLKRVGAVDRALAHGLIGAALSFSLFAVIHWTVELTAVAISASALGGTCNRWLAGGTDLFVERG